MGDDGSRLTTTDREHLLSVPQGPHDPNKSSSSQPYSSHEAFHGVLRSWASKKFMSGCVILLPITITFYVTWWFVKFVDGFFSPIYAQLGIHIFGLPALVVPCGFTSGSVQLPVGIQFIGNSFEEEKLLQTGHVFEQTLESSGFLPPII